jgi:hypothetical protein
MMTVSLIHKDQASISVLQHPNLEEDLEGCRLSAYRFATLRRVTKQDPLGSMYEEGAAVLCTIPSSQGCGAARIHQLGCADVKRTNEMIVSILLPPKMVAPTRDLQLSRPKKFTRRQILCSIPIKCVTSPSADVKELGEYAGERAKAEALLGIHESDVTRVSRRWREEAIPTFCQLIRVYCLYIVASDYLVMT